MKYLFAVAAFLAVTNVQAQTKTLWKDCPLKAHPEIEVETYEDMKEFKPYVTTVTNTKTTAVYDFKLTMTRKQARKAHDKYVHLVATQKISVYQHENDPDFGSEFSDEKDAE